MSSWDPEIKCQSAEWRSSGSPRLKKALRKQGSAKVMHIMFFDMKGVVVNWPAPHNIFVNGHLQMVPVDETGVLSGRSDQSCLYSDRVSFSCMTVSLHITKERRFSNSFPIFTRLIIILRFLSLLSSEDKSSKHISVEIIEACNAFVTTLEDMKTGIYALLHDGRNAKLLKTIMFNDTSFFVRTQFSFVS